MKALLLLAAFAPTARADTVTTQPLALVGRGVSVGYERELGPRLSVVALFGGRAAARGDYSSRTASAGAELRYRPLARHGLFLALHASAGRTRLVDETIDAGIGTNVELAERVDVGWRFIAWRRLTLAPTLGVGVVEDVDPSGRMTAYTAPTATFGFEVGYRF